MPQDFSIKALVADAWSIIDRYELRRPGYTLHVSLNVDDTNEPDKEPETIVKIDYSQPGDTGKTIASTFNIGPNMALISFQAQCMRIKPETV